MFGLSFLLYNTSSCTMKISVLFSLSGPWLSPQALLRIQVHVHPDYYFAFHMIDSQWVDYRVARNYETQVVLKSYSWNSQFLGF